MIRLRPSGVDEILIKRVQDWYEPGPGVFIQSLTASFSPAMLFTGSTTGAWYDPSDITTLYRDAAGTQPVTAVEQPVGLMLDKSKGLVLGPELVTNGDFSTDTAWTKGTGITIADGKSTFTSVAAGQSLSQVNVVPAGKTYQITFTVSGYSSGSFVVYCGAGSTGGPAINASGTYTQRLSSSGTPTIYFYANVSNTSLSIDNISVRELPGNHAFNPSGNSANFPVLSARYNLLTKTEQFDDAAWAKANATVTANSVAAPDGTLTADKLVENTANSTHEANQSATVGNTTIRGFVFAKAAERSKLRIDFTDLTTGDAYVDFDLGTGQYSNVGFAGSWTSPSASVAAAGNGWYCCTLTATKGAGTSVSMKIQMRDSSGNISYTGDGTSGIYIWGADLRVTNDALNQPAYQRVNTATDYDTVGFKPYLRFNGTNQWLQTNSIDFSYGDKMFVCAGIRKLSDAAQSNVVELSTNAATNNGTFYLSNPNGPGTTVNFLTKGTSLVQSYYNEISAPLTNVFSGTSDFSIPLSKLRTNGIEKASTTASAGTGNYGNYPMFLGARAGTTLWANIRFYGLVVAGKQASAAEITSTETYINQKTGAY